MNDQEWPLPIKGTKIGKNLQKCPKCSKMAMDGENRLNA